MKTPAKPGLDALLRAVQTTVADSGRDLTLKQMAVLLCADGKATMAGLARSLGISPSAMVRACDTLAEYGLVTRQADKEDRRTFSVQPTTAGLAYLADVVEAAGKQP